MRRSWAYGLAALVLTSGFGALVTSVHSGQSGWRRATAEPVGQRNPTPPVQAAPPREPPPAPAANPSFDAWLAAFRAQAAAAGISAEVLDRELAGLTPDPRVVALDNSQPDRSSTSRLTFQDYRDAQVSADRIRRGRRLASDLSATLSSVHAQHGVEPEILLAIWGKETSYGVAAGRLDIVRSLATLAHDGRRRQFFTDELIAALKLIDSGAANRKTLVGSWAGATGQTQFMPTSYLASAADGDGDGRADIWSNRSDALASIAAYLKAHGWRGGEPWVVKARVPDAMNRGAVAGEANGACAGLNWRHSRWLSVGEWRRLGVRLETSRLVPDNALATLIEPDGPAGPAYLTFSNYRAIMAYNCTNYYALAVTDLADEITAGRPLPPLYTAARSEALGRRLAR